MTVTIYHSTRRIENGTHIKQVAEYRGVPSALRALKIPCINMDMEITWEGRTITVDGMSFDRDSIAVWCIDKK